MFHTAQGLAGFSESTPKERRHDGDRSALWLVIVCLCKFQLIRSFRSFIIAVLAMISIGIQNYLFASSAASLTSKLRSLSFRAILRQDSMLPPGFLVDSS